MKPITQMIKRGACSTWRGLVTISSLADEVRAQLPHEFYIEPGKPNVQAHLFGCHDNLHYIVNGCASPVWPIILKSYNEVIRLIPWVRCSEHDGPHLFIVGMTLDKRLPVILGNWFYSYRKRYGDVYAEDNFVGKDRLHGFNNFDEIDEIFGQPVLGCGVDEKNRVERLVRSRWSVKPRKSRVAGRSTTAVMYKAELDWAIDMERG